MTVRRRRSDRSGRSKLHSPGRPDSARREELVRFWAAIATGRSSEDAARDAGVSPPVGSRWFRRSGLTLAPNHACCLPIRAFLFTGVGGFFKADLARAEPVINRRSRRNHLVNFVQTLRQLLQCRVWRLLNPAQDILAVRIKTALARRPWLDRDSPLVFISPDIPHRRACAHLKKGRRLTARHARRHFPRQTNTQVFRYSHDAPAKAAIESVRQDHDNKILIHSTSETL